MNTLETQNQLKVIVQELGRIPQPVVTSYQLGHLMFSACLHGAMDEFGRGLPQNIQFSRVLRGLLDIGVLTKYPDLPEGYYKVLGKPGAEAEEIFCAIDPFCYVSHLSAMAYYGVTDRLPRTVFVSSPAPSEWKDLAIALMKKDLGEQYDNYMEQGFPAVVRPYPKKIVGRAVNIRYSSRLGAYRNIQGKSLRVSTIGRTFLDMLRAPELCGGIQHVVDVYKEHAERYLRQITDEIGAHGKAIEKVRAGFILEHEADVRDPRIDAWQTEVQRGGSRKLDPGSEYSPFFSERWALSLNLPSINANAD